MTLNRDQVLVFDTGFGKSLIFWIFSLLHTRLIVVVMPLNALINDNSLKLASRGVSVGVLTSESGGSDSLLWQIKNGYIKVVFTTPESFNMYYDLFETLYKDKRIQTGYYSFMGKYVQPFGCPNRKNS